jgi:hypothetical protein
VNPALTDFGAFRIETEAGAFGARDIGLDGAIAVFCQATNIADTQAYLIFFLL